MRFPENPMLNQKNYLQKYSKPGRKTGLFICALQHLYVP